MSYARRLGHAIDLLRLQRGISKKQMALETGIDAGNLNRVISGKQWLTPERLEIIAAYFGLKPSDIFRIADHGRLDPPLPAEDPRKAILKRFIDSLDGAALETFFAASAGEREPLALPPPNAINHSRRRTDPVPGRH
jgi:transcriptional regulator with XRE-family HTH domain